MTHQGKRSATANGSVRCRQSLEGFAALCHLSRFTRRVVVLAAIVTPFAVSPAAADLTFEPISGVTVENAVATPALKGGDSELRFRIVNSGVEDLALTGVRSSSAVTGALVMEDPVLGPHEIATLTIKAEEEIDLTTSHVRAELRGLRHDLNAGDYVRFELVLRGGAVAGEAHVHNR